MPIDTDLTLRVRSTLAEYLKRDVTTIKPGDALRDDLGLDSLSTIELLYRIDDSRCGCLPPAESRPSLNRCLGYGPGSKASIARRHAGHDCRAHGATSPLQQHLGGTRSEKRCTRKSVYNQEPRELLKSGGHVCLLPPFSLTANSSRIYRSRASPLAARRWEA